MFKYEYFTVDGSKFSGSKFIEHRDIINEYAQKGYRYVGFVPTNIAEYGKFKKIDLIFEIEK